MSALFSTIGVAFGLFLIFLFIVVVSTIGLKSIFSSMFTFMKSLFNMGNSAEVEMFLKNIQNNDIKNSSMKIISITSGTCDCCGKTYIGTTSDRDDIPLKEVSIFGGTKVLCNDCLDKIKKIWDKKGNSKDVIFTKSAENLKDIFNNQNK